MGMRKGPLLIRGVIGVRMRYISTTIALVVSMLSTSLACTAVKKSSADPGAVAKKKKATEGTDDFGYLIPLEYFGYSEDDVGGKLLTNRPLFTSSILQPVAETYVISTALDRRPNNIDDIKLAIFRPFRGQTCDEFQSLLETKDFDKSQHRYFLTQKDSIIYDGDSNALVWTASKTDAGSECSAILAASALPDNATELGYRPLNGAVAFAFIGADAVTNDPMDKRLIFATSGSGSMVRSVIQETPTASANPILAALPDGAGFIISTNYNELFEYRHDDWVQRGLSWQSGQFQVLGISSEIVNGQERTYVLRGHSDIAPTVFVDERTSATGFFTSINGTEGFRGHAIMGTSNIEGNKVAFFDEQILRVSSLMDMGYHLYETANLEDDNGSPCIDIYSRASSLAANGDVHFTFTCQREIDANHTVSPIYLGHFTAADAVNYSLVPFKLAEDAVIANSNVSRAYQPTILLGRNGDTHYLFRSTSGLKLFHGHLTSDRQLTVREINVDASGTAFSGGADRLSAALDQEVGVIHIAFQASDGANNIASFYGVYVLGTDRLRAEQLAGGVDSNNFNGISTMVKWPP